MSTNEDKHRSGNPLQAALIANLHRHALGYVRRSVPAQGGRVLDAGCGEGFTLDYLLRGGVAGRLVGVDASLLALEEAARSLGERAQLRQGRLEELDAVAPGPWDCVLCLEVLEHLEDPGEARSALRALDAPFYVFSVPHEPLFRGLNFLRGRHWRAWGNHPEHLQQWGRQDFLGWLGEEFEILESPRVPPWTMAYARPRVR